MKQLLGSAQAVLQSFVGRDVLVALDFDGTLAPLHPFHQGAGMRPSTARLLAELSLRQSVAVVSGRSCDDVRQRLPATGQIHVIGNHGLEPSPHLAAWRAQSAETLHAVAAKLARFAGVQIEDKGASFAVHYRHARRTGWARRKIVATLQASRRPMRLVGGKCVINVLPADAADKGQATWQLCRQLGCERVLYVGDDLTDEDVFRSGEPDRLLSVRIGRSHQSAARYYLNNQAQIDVLLTRLLELVGDAAAVSRDRTG